ncbi:MULTISPECIES: EAL domain-containing protein [unclassified Coleofasciculus]|uniref:EAL domain-containing protein n=1 Tax=Cyanophyceae TaxID=3028117 RepID=UPI001F55664D|nr:MULTISPECIES: EAL domain-containing protein [unclassified Coleofasciculus]
MLQFLKNLISPNWFIPHGRGYLWQPGLVSLHIVADALIAIAYYSIALALLYFIHQRQDLPFRRIFFLFGAFIVSCGTTHLMEIWTLWHPAYWLSGAVKVITAIISGYTAVELIRLIPKALAIPSQAQLEATNQKLSQEVIERQQAEAALRHSEARFRSIFEGAGMGIAIVDMEGHVVTTNPALQRMLGCKEDNLPAGYIQEDTTPNEVGWDRYINLLAGKYDYSQMAKRYLGKDGHLIWGRDCYQMEQRYLGKNGQLLWCNITVSQVRDAEGKPQFGIRLVEDITARKKAEAALKQYQEHLEKVVGERTAELTKVNEKLSWQANHDPLTGIANRHEFEQRLQEAVSNTRMQNQEHTLCYLDLDRFKIVNDTCGHVAGDELLRQISSLLQSRVRRTDVLARLGGDEFAVLLYQCPTDEALRVAQSLLETIQEFRFAWQDKTFTVGVSIGVVTFDANSSSLSGVVSAADAACYEAKNRGRNRVYVYQADDQKLAQQHNEVQWLSRLNQAIAQSGSVKLLATPENTLPAKNQFCLYYQPIAPLNAELTTGEHYEVLLRFVDDRGELIPPMAFLPAAERYNLMPAIDRWVIRTFLAMLHQSEIQNLEPQFQNFASYPRGRIRNSFVAGASNVATSPPLTPYILPPSSFPLYTINLSGATVNDDQFIEFLKKQFSVYKIPPQMICFEITESVAIANLSKVSGLIKEVKALGCRFALDDFGSGMSSFAYLKYLPLDYLKIDGSFVKDIADDPIHLALVEAINRVGHVMGLKTIAEFVTNDSILEKVKFLGIDYAQGYVIAKPQPLEFN